MASAEARQLDFWVGDWAVASPGMAGKGHSTVHLSLDKCMMIESWGSDTSNHDGENTLAYNAEDKSWYGLFVDNQGRVHMMKGAVTPGSAEFQGSGRDENGGEVVKRVRVGRSRQIMEPVGSSTSRWSTCARNLDRVRINREAGLPGHSCHRSRRAASVASATSRPSASLRFAVIPLQYGDPETGRHCGPVLNAWNVQESGIRRAKS
jgi:hypothetical protein